MYDAEYTEASEVFMVNMDCSDLKGFRLIDPERVIILRCSKEADQLLNKCGLYMSYYGVAVDPKPLRGCIVFLAYRASTRTIIELRRKGAIVVSWPSIIKRLPKWARGLVKPGRMEYRRSKLYKIIKVILEYSVQGHTVTAVRDIIFRKFGKKLTFRFIGWVKRLARETNHNIRLILRIVRGWLKKLFWQRRNYMTKEDNKIIQWMIEQGLITL